MRNVCNNCRTKLYAYPSSVDVFQVALTMLIQLMSSTLMLWVSTVVSRVGIKSIDPLHHCFDVDRFCKVFCKA